MRTVVLGSGTWGTALAAVLAREGRPVTLLCRRAEMAEEIARGTHPRLPDLVLPGSIETAVFGERLDGIDAVLSTIPTQRIREVMGAIGGTLPLDVPWVSGSKGLEVGTQLLPSEVLRECGVAEEVAILSGPSHAEEVVREVPTAVVLAHTDPDRAELLQEAIADPAFRVYSSTDPTGVEWGGALKNVVAIASGIAIGRGFGDNTIAALVSRGAVEMARLGASLGGRRETFSGLSGVGDLIVTCFSAHSRNRAFGIAVGEGADARACIDAGTHVVEGYHTCRAVHELREKRSVEMPIAETVYAIVHGGQGVDEGIRSLLGRSLKEE